MNETIALERAQMENSADPTPVDVRGQSHDHRSGKSKSGSFAAENQLAKDTTSEYVDRRAINTAVRSEVCFKVQQNALMLREFTFADIKKATGLKESSVRTQLQRMREQGYLTSHSLNDSSRQRLYRLTKDPQKRLELVDRVGAFSSISTENQELVRPSSRALERLQWLGQQIYESLVNRRKSKELLTQATVALRHAWLAEGVDVDEETDIERLEPLEDEDDELTPHSVRAYLSFEQLQLAYLSHRLGLMEHSNIPTYLEYLEQLLGYFIERDPVMIDQIRALQIQFQALQLQLEDTLDPDLTPIMHAAQCLLKAMKSAGYQPNSSLFQEVQQYLWHLSQPAASFISKKMIRNSVEIFADEEMGRIPARVTHVVTDRRLYNMNPLARFSTSRGAVQQSSPLTWQTPDVRDTIDQMRKIQTPTVRYDYDV